MRLALAALLALTTNAFAQPADPYAPAAPTGDAVLAEQVAQQLADRAQALFDAKQYADAKQIALEAIAQSNTGAAAAHARYLVKLVNIQLGLKDDTPPPPPIEKPTAPVKSPMPDPTAPVVEPMPTAPIETLTKPLPPLPLPSQPPAEAERMSAPLDTKRIAEITHSSLYGGLFGAMIGSLFSSRHPAAGAIPVSIVAAGAAGYFLPPLIDRIGASEAQIRTVGMATVWGGVIGSFFADAVTPGSTSARQILIGGTIGATVLGGAGALLASKDTLTRGDVAMIDTFAGAGAFGALTIGMLMQPARNEAYSINAVIGTTAGLVVGYIAAPQVNATPRRMLRIAALGALGGALPFLLYAAIHDKTTTSDEQLTGVLSTAGIVGGLYLGFRWTEGMDDGLDTMDGKKHEDPVAVINRSSDGRWDLGALALRPLDPTLAPQRGLALDIVGARF